MFASSIGMRLQDKKLDINAQVQQTQQKITSLAKKNDMRSKDIAAKQREEDFFTLQRMKQWCDTCFFLGAV
jgi:hypothetical protein